MVGGSFHLIIDMEVLFSYRVWMTFGLGSGQDKSPDLG